MRDATAPMRVEPMALEHDQAADTERAGGDEMPSEQPNVPGYEVPGDLHGENAVFGLLGTPAAAGQITAQRTQRGQDLHVACESQAASASGPDQGMTPDVIGALHDQYWRALDDPLASLAGDWSSHAGLADDPHEDAPHALDGPRRESEAEVAAMSGGSIEALLSGVRTLEECFGPLSAAPGSCDSRDWRVDSVPEILRLFAPPEYHAAASQRSRALPPALARREHHALGIDSPLPASGWQRSSSVSGESGGIEFGQETRVTGTADTSLFESPACEFSNSATSRKLAQQGGSVGTV